MGNGLEDAERAGEIFKPSHTELEIEAPFSVVGASRLAHHSVGNIDDGCLPQHR